MNFLSLINYFSSCYCSSFLHLVKYLFLCCSLKISLTIRSDSDVSPVFPEHPLHTSAIGFIILYYIHLLICLNH